jgi:predicted dehydrogenase
MARGHASAFVNNPRVDLVACADISEAARDRFAQEFNIPSTYSDPAEMLDQERPDLVSICTWPPLHAEQTELAFSRGTKGVWCEKPMAVHLTEADRMVAAAEVAGGVLVINHQRRYLTRYLQAIDLISKGTIGEIIQINGICGGDALTDGTHLIDMTRWLNNDVPVTAVFGAIDMTPKGDVSPDGMGTVEFNQTRMRYGHHVESGSLGMLFFENGVRGHLEMGNLARPGYQRFIIEGTEGRIEVSGDQDFADGTKVKVYLNSGEPVVVAESTNDGSMEGVLADLIASVETGAPHRLSGESGREDLEIVNAIYESARRHMIIGLPLEVLQSPLEAMLESGEISLN